MDDDREVSRLHRVNRTIKELVRDRGYEVSDAEINVSLDEFKASDPISNKSTRLNFAAINPETNQGIYVYYSDEKSVGIKTMRKFISILDEKKLESGILIYSQAMTPSANKVIASMAQQFTLEAFQEAELLVNITRHIMVPKHEVMKPEEKKALLARYRLKDTQLPRIQLSDPVARYYGLKRGQVVRITRPSETAGRYVSYRLAM
ncbi:DNA-directed RNA polymerases II 24 kDa polypeptide (RNA polymerase II subunit 5) [Puccinia graminis f. sp. tritici]|uniref:DNA-directed RNA polymerases I, II, and III subunit RPABC1 n=2 Tax=Puccinia graminis f. sp. tritici TaxID=56615 RepID=E3K8W7_PUCGT|nr:DNA-directed RNA polymerase II subunit E [Puccinia graminis f. sp. tritici CRL 75-36-700-3]KAA1067391.1 DNA-directed RNA polymerases II 24 kDa polypeptide (RNA polymerase II subunit 5) [Puccinia graminis f. sp. tritici]EFP80556.1 DNA-directed RNA polymerase II subunit E [Puccinia graminis f. sp. tritici CRL 75-36-700-3]KAA1111522.1 DNA-directed RNA polymerases II 24 kDa polypeptide (RNA polymerase II subunit 5) [Puccinia graminis f. sp. tritici]KAA1123771.1 DNA-directed RNA polymerases II 24